MMSVTPSYPIVHQRALLEAPKRGPLGFRGRRRAFDELPRVDAHEVLVYRVNGEYLVDAGRLALDDDRVVQATHVSVVDLRRDTPVSVELGIPSAEASEFTIRATFVCTVTDAVAVVREGHHDAATLLRAYVRSHHRLLELGLEHRMSAINTVRRDVRAQVQAYTQLKPPVVHGLSVSYKSAEVLTPDELVDLHKTLRDQERDHTIASGRQRHDRDLKREQEEGEHALEQLRKEQELKLQEQQQLIEEQRQEFEQRFSQQTKFFEQLLAREDRKFAQVELGEISESVGDNPLKAATFAHVKGELTAMELEQRLQAEKDRERADAQTQTDQAREDRLREEGWNRDDTRQRRMWKHEERLHAQILREKRHERKQAGIEAQEEKDREDRLRQLAWEREDRSRILDVRLNVLKELASRGHLDEIDIGIDDLLRGLTAGTENGAQPEVSASPIDHQQHPVLEAADADADDQRDEDG